MNSIRVQVDQVSFFVSPVHEMEQLRGEITAAVRRGGDFVRLELVDGSESFVMCSSGLSITVSRARTAEPVVSPDDSAEKLAGSLDDPLLDLTI